jgi:hypothetical protein
MSPPMTKVSLPGPQQRLVELLQDINFGRIEGLAVRGGNPILDPPPRIVREIRFCGENGPRPERQAADYLLKVQVVELLRYLDEVRDGTVETLEVKHGLPFRMMLEGPVP